MDTAAVHALFSDYGSTLTRTAAELEAALHRHGYAGPLSDWLSMLRAGGLREPRRGIFGAPWEPTEYRETIRNYSEESDNKRNTIGIELAPASEAAPPELPADSSSKAVIADAVSAAPEPPQFSYFRGGIRNAAPYTAVTPRQLWEMIHGPMFAPATAQLRQAAAGSEARAEQKKLLDYVTPAGTFAPTRANGNLATSSGLLVLDFDHLPDVGTARATLLADPLLSPALVVVFTSPGGEGLKAILEADPTASHLDNFRVLSGYLLGSYGPELQPDPSGKDVARACFVCHDADAWINPRFAG
jgi:hypothetical protein